MEPHTMAKIIQPLAALERTSMPHSGDSPAGAARSHSDGGGMAPTPVGGGGGGTGGGHWGAAWGGEAGVSAPGEPVLAVGGDGYENGCGGGGAGGYPGAELGSWSVAKNDW